MTETGPTARGGRYRVLDLEIDLARQTVRRGAEPIPLPALSFRLLAALVRHAPDPMGKDELIREIWGDVVVSDETLSQRVRLLRQALGEDAQDPRYVSSVRGRGYRLICPVESLPPDHPDRPARTRRRVWPALAAAVLLAVAIGFMVAGPGDRPPAPDVHSVAVLPFADLSPDQDHRYFADGMQEELLSRLAKLENLELVSRTSVEKYRGTDLSLPEIAGALGVDAVIESSLRVADDRVRITVQLIDGQTDRHLWAETYDRELSVENIFSIQQEVAEQVGQALALEFTTGQSSAVGPLPTASIAAYDAYLIGRYHTYQQTPEDLQLAIGYLEQAVEIDPEFAEAYAQLGWAYSFIGTVYGRQPPREVYPKAKAAVTRALSINNRLANARTLYADILAWYDWDFAAAEREYRKTIELDPLNVLGYSLFLSTQLRHEEAIALLERRIAAVPDEPWVRINAAWAFMRAGQYARAIEEAKLGGQHADARSVLGFTALRMGDADRAIEAFEEDLREKGRQPRQLSHLAIAYYKAGRDAEAQQLLEELIAAADAGYVAPSQLAGAYFAAGDADKGFAAMDAAVAARDRGVIFIQTDMMLDGYRDDPRYQALVRAVGF